MKKLRYVAFDLAIKLVSRKNTGIKSNVMFGTTCDFDSDVIVHKIS